MNDEQRVEQVARVLVRLLDPLGRLEWSAYADEARDLLAALRPEEDVQ